MKHTQKYVSLFLIFLTGVFYFFSKTEITHGSNFSSYQTGSAALFSGDISGSVYNTGNTTLFDIGGKSFSSYAAGGVTLYSGNGISGSAYSTGNTTLYNINNLNFSSYNVGNTTLYSGDITGSAYRIGNTTLYNAQNKTNNFVKLPQVSPIVPRYPIMPRNFYPSLNSNYINATMLYESSKISVNQPSSIPIPTPTLTLTPIPLGENLSKAFDESASQANDIVGNVGAPDIVSAVGAGEGKVRVTWTALPNAEKYYIFYGNSSGNYIYETPTNGTTTSHEIGGLQKGSKYFFAIQAQFTAETPFPGRSHPEYFSSKGKEASIVVQ